MRTDPDPLASHLTPAVRTPRVVIVTPCFNRPADAAQLLADLGALDRAGAELAVILIDNASDPPLAPALRPLTPPDIPVSFIRHAENTGGSGGYSSGIAHALAWRSHAGEPADFIWLLDSDARVAPDALKPLLDALAADPSLAAVGSAITDPATGALHELGGRIDRRTGAYGPMTTAADRPLRADYLAACSALVRTDAVRLTGLFPDTFLNGDDVAWFLRMDRLWSAEHRTSAGSLAAVPASRVAHPRFDRYATWQRYYIARNGFTPLAELGSGPLVRLRRALNQTAAAAGLTALGRRDLADLHLLGLAHAAASRTRGRTPLPPAAQHRPWSELPAALAGVRTRSVTLQSDLSELGVPIGDIRRALAHADIRERPAGAHSLGACLVAAARALLGARTDLAIVDPDASPSLWFRARRTLTAHAAGFTIASTPRFAGIAACAAVCARGLWSSLSLAMRAPATPACAPVPPAAHTHMPTLSIIVLAFNRKPAVERTLRELLSSPVTKSAQIILVDNASSDGTADFVRTNFPAVTLVALSTNSGVAGFNRGVDAATGDLVLILDDDSWPDPDSLASAVRALADNPSLGGATLLPRHPTTKHCEWPIAERLAGRVVDDWPIMGCGNLVRTHLWRALGGYEESFFLYRNDWDLALKLIGAGFGVRFDPAWTVWHDSNAVAAKSARWCFLATRNWVWLARRHGRGAALVIGPLLALARALMLAGFSPSKLAAAFKGFFQGCFGPCAPLQPQVTRSAPAFAALVRLKVRELTGRGL